MDRESSRGAMPTPKDQEIRLRISATEKARIEAAANARGWSIAQLVREAVRVFLDAQQLS